MSTTTTWPGGSVDASPTAYTVPASGELNWSSLSSFLNVLATSAQSTTAQKWGVRKATATPVTVSATADCVVVCQLTVPAAVTVNLPAGANKQVFVIVDGTGDASSNNITINRNGSDTIAGATSLVLSANRETVILVYNSGDTDWKIASRSVGSGAPAAVPAAGVVSSSGTALTSGGNDTGDALINTAQGDPATPTYSFVGDGNTGVYRSAADTLNASTAGTSRWAINSSGQVSVSATTDSSSSTTGSWITAGGIGVAKQIWTDTKVVATTGMQFKNTGNGSDTISYYRATSSSSTWTWNGSGGTSGSISYLATRIGRMVFIEFAASQATTGTSSTQLTQQSALESDFRPTAELIIPITVNDNGTRSIGQCVIQTSGVLIIQKAGQTAFANGTTSGAADRFSLCYATS